mmetsp:Transcript_117625/g.379661  ORF Transcript_117625/g.379661 Transcript_117625/m.379661 type:complete len:226 (+) Transcript_117625:480-1157(+)
MVRPPTSRPRFGNTMRRNSGSPPASNCGDTSGLPTQSLNFAFTLSMRHSTRVTSVPPTSRVCTVRLSSTGRLRPGGGGMTSVCDIDLPNNACSSGTLGSVIGGAVFKRLPRRAAPKLGGTSAGSSNTAGASQAFPAKLLSFFCKSRVSLSMSAMSLEIWPRDRSSFCTREPMVCTWASSAGAWWQAWAAMSAKGRVLAARGVLGKAGIIPAMGVPATGVPATGEP